ncbi:MAG: NgoPII family restriction endonuclease [Hydrococcus sp. Prado102]|jgi:hypothetical protein|nr:NgoPII family restriction endonuclease [Hydrococcus sp. Prado102]
MNNILQAIFTITANKIPDVVSFYRSKNKINAAGDALELFVKDIFANTLNETGENKKAEIYQTIFSYFGNANNPPDFIIKDGDAVEVKKLESETASIALNSSYPSTKLFADSPMITRACRECEQWSTKDLIYAIGCVKQQKLSLLWLVYGDCYAANREIYERIRTKIAAGISEIAEVEFSPTKELGRVNKVDPLGITYLRIRGMWHIEHPQKVYSYLNLKYEAKKSFRLFALMRESKYLSFPIEDRKTLEKTNVSGFEIQDVKIKLPDNPVQLISAKLISYQI